MTSTPDAVDPHDTSATTTTTTAASSPTSTTPTASRPVASVVRHGRAHAGNGSSFAAPAVDQLGDDVGQSPYNLSVLTRRAPRARGATSSPTGRSTTRSATPATWIRASARRRRVSLHFIPITAAGIAFMYNIPGLTKTLQLTSYTACPS